MIKVVKIIPIIQKIKTSGVNFLHASGKDGKQSVFIFTFIFFLKLKNDSLDI